MTPEKRRKAWMIAGAALLVALLVLIATSNSVKMRVDAAALRIIHLAEAHPTWGAVIFVIYSAISAMLAFASSAVLIPPATAVWGKLGTFLLLWGGWMLGMIAAYGLGRLATPLIVKLGYQKKLAEYQKFMSDRMRFWSVLTFCLMVPSEIPGYLFGSAHYSFPRFLIAVALAEAAYAAVFVLALERVMELRPAVGLLVIVGMIILGGVGAWVLRKRKLKPGPAS